MRYAARKIRTLGLAPIVTLLVLLGVGACQGEAGRPGPAEGKAGGHPIFPAAQPGQGVPRFTTKESGAPKALYRILTGEKAVALTYDDGPTPGKAATQGVLAVLEHDHVHATFFVIGQEAERHPDLLREERTDGMEVENHGYRHVSLAQLSSDGQRAQIQQGAKAIEDAGLPPPHFLRPPFGSQSAALRRTAEHLGERVVIWTVDPRDWANPGTGTVTNFVLTHIEPGAIVLLHDGGGNRSQTVEATRALVPALERQGYRLVTLKTLIRLEGKGFAAPPAAAGRSKGAPAAAKTRTTKVPRS